ncbi:hypothetical protein, partial [Oscillibacter sp.]|uniref:hypothetical protein n=1 Tax=Oscillibacter sp. TaxID=1945593 RepID=UPI00289F4208
NHVYFCLSESAQLIVPYPCYQDKNKEFKTNVAFFCFSDTSITKGNRNQRSHATGGAKGADRCSKYYCKGILHISIPADSLQNEKRGIT